MARRARGFRETYTIHLDGSWSLEDLYKFPRAYEHVYFLINALEFSGAYYVGEDVDDIFRAFPWFGGYSAVGFYNNLKYRTPAPQRPKIVSIEYASPGWLELSLLVVAALKIEAIVKSIANSIDHVNATYNRIMRGAHDRKLSDIKLRREQLILEKETLHFIHQSTDLMAQMLGLENVKELDEKTGNRLISLKILLSLYRRVKVLADYQLNGKADFSNSRDQSEDGDLLS